MTRSKLHSWLDTLIPSIGAGCLGLGFLVLFGWFTRTDSLLQPQPHVRAMVPNTALCFMLGGAALLGLALGRASLAGVCGVFVACMGAVVGSQYLFGTDLGIDRLLIEPYITVETPSPGRMAPHTVVCMLSAGAAFVLLAHPGAWSWQPLASAVLGVIVTALAVDGLVGFWTNIRVEYAWGPLIPMAAHTAAGCAVLGSGIVASAWRERSEVASLPRWLPILVGVAITTFTVTQWEAARAFADAHRAVDGGQGRWLAIAILCWGVFFACGSAVGLHVAQRRWARTQATRSARSVLEPEA